MDSSLPPAAAPRARPAALAPPAPPGSVTPPAPVASPFWSAFDQEIMDTVLFASGVPTHSGMMLNAGNGSGRLPRASSGLLSPSAALRSGILAPPLSFVSSEPVIAAAASAIAASLPFDASLDRLASPSPSFDVMSAAESSEAGSSTTAKPKRKRKYNDNSRAKHREVQRRFIVRKKEKLEQEKKFADVMETQVKIHELKTEAETLERERSSLLQQCVASGVDLDSHDMSIFLEEEMETLSQYYTPLQPNESSAIMQQTLRYIDGFCPDEAFLDDGKNLAGWNQQTRVEHKTISFRLAKEFPDSLAAQVFERTGYSMAMVQFFSQFFGAGVVIKTHLLQLIDLNTVVVYRAIYHPVTKEIARSVELLCRVQRGDSYLILMQSLEGLNIQNYVGTRETWTRGVVWCQINAKKASDKGCTIQWTGCVGQCPMESLEHWGNDLVFLVLRYEGLVIAPLVTLTIQDEEPTATDPKAAARATSSEDEETRVAGVKRQRDENDRDKDDDDGEHSSTDESVSST